MSAESVATNTSGDAIRSLSPRVLSDKQKEVFEIVLAAHRRGIRDMSGSEIVEACERQYRRRFKEGSTSARINELVAAGRLARRAQSRPCSLTGHNVRPVYVPEQQSRLFT